MLKKIIKSFFIIVLISIILSVLIYGFLIFVFVITAFDADPDTNIIAKIYYSLAVLPLWYFFDIVLGLFSLIFLIFLYFKNKWKLKELFFLALLILIFSFVLTAGFHSYGVKKSKINLQQHQIQQQLIDGAYKIDKMKAKFINLNSSNPVYKGKIYLTGKTVGIYEYVLTIYANEIKASTIKETVNLSKNNEVISVDLPLEKLTRAWMDKRMNKTNVKAGFPLQITTNIKLKLIEDAKGSLTKGTNFEEKRFVSNEIGVILDYGEISFTPSWDY